MVWTRPKRWGGTSMSVTRMPANLRRRLPPSAELRPILRAVLRYGGLVVLAVLLILIALPAILGAAAAGAAGV
jgi:hypothetical protein